MSSSICNLTVETETKKVF